MAPTSTAIRSGKSRRRAANDGASGGVVDMATADGWDADRALSLAAALEGDSEHLIAQAIRRYARDRKVTLPSIIHFSALQGRGVQADFENQPAYSPGG